MMDSGYRALAAAVCLQAVDDWEKLCKCYAAGLCECTADGHTIWDRSQRAAVNAYNRMGQTSFYELTLFFTHSGDLYANCDTEPLLRMLQQKRRAAQRRHNAHKSRQTTQ